MDILLPIIAFLIVAGGVLGIPELSKRGRSTPMSPPQPTEPTQSTYRRPAPPTTLQDTELSDRLRSTRTMLEDLEESGNLWPSATADVYGWKLDNDDESISSRQLYEDAYRILQDMRSTNRTFGTLNLMQIDKINEWLTAYDQEGRQS